MLKYFLILSILIRFYVKIWTGMATYAKPLLLYTNYIPINIQIFTYDKHKIYKLFRIFKVHFKTQFKKIML